ncbi:MAG TPA: YraN family protein [Desulfobacterales bacterium]|nr:YraN family protein [Desulfobacterales bacterium]
MSGYRLSLGREGERLAGLYLQKSGYRIIERNFRFRGGEIDIIARQGEYLVFVEVKTRSTLAYGVPAAAVDVRKQWQIIQTARFYMAKHHIKEVAMRFDVVAILLPKSGKTLIELIPHAFTV